MPRPQRNPAPKPAASDNQTTGEVRIIGGDLRRRKLAYSGDPRTRPMKDRVREAIFNLLGDISGVLAIDLFAGTGALGLEAISRGASRAILIEKHFPTADAISQSTRALGIADKCDVHGGDTFVWCKRRPELGDAPWLVFCSPPYSFFVERAAEMEQLLTALVVSAPPGSRFVVEGDAQMNLAALPQSLTWSVHHYPPAVVAIGEAG